MDLHIEDVEILGEVFKKDLKGEADPVDVFTQELVVTDLNSVLTGMGLHMAEEEIEGEDNETYYMRVVYSSD